MTTPQFVRSLVVAAVTACLAAGATACGGGDDTQEPGERASGDGAKSAGALTSWSRACDGIFDAETTAVLREGGKGDAVYELPRDGGAKSGVADAGEKLREGMDHRVPATPVCRLEDERGRRLLDISFEWDQAAFPPEAAEAGKSVTYEAQEPLTFVLVDCRRPDLTDSGGTMRALRGIMDDRAGLNERARVKALYASAANVLATLDCRNEVNFPGPPKTVPGLT
ncbi:hypothetical protein ACFVWZ_32585 [Streptomyces sp. NPDC058200]|uniref:hypothetical protein n=1 Tax=Streptomyces sp. NPDC058200 TaxID=3346378 RepID=UPI0036E2EC2C